MNNTDDEGNLATTTHGGDQSRELIGGEGWIRVEPCALGSDVDLVNWLEAATRYLRKGH